MAKFNIALGKGIHHIVLISLVAPLAGRFIFSRAMLLDRVPTIFIFVFHTTMLWLWHLPLPYAWALSGSTPYWIMETPRRRGFRRRCSTADRRCTCCLRRNASADDRRLARSSASRPLFNPHYLTSLTYSLSPLEDQQLAGDDARTKALVQQMVPDHQKTSSELKALISGGRVQAQLPGAMTSAQRGICSTS
ncbi:hypothetical protein EV128_14030 [Rhizobium azibense]|nr:hypothetical protein EV128_14030 [Rhizobium azibense]